MLGALIVIIALHFIYIPTRRGKVIDEAIKEPLEGVKVLVVHYKIVETLAGSVGDSFSPYITETDRNGEFKIPAVLRVKALWPFGQYDGMEIFFRKEGYQYIKMNDKEYFLHKTDICIKKLMTEEEHFKNIERLLKFTYWLKSDYSQKEDYYFLIAELQNFIKRFPNSKEKNKYTKANCNYP